MEQAKAADGYLPKWRSNHSPRRRREGEKKNKSSILTLMILQCSAAIQQQTAVLPQELLNTNWVQPLFLTQNLIIPIFKLLHVEIVSISQRFGFYHHTEVPGWLQCVFLPTKRVQEFLMLKSLGTSIYPFLATY